VTETRGVLILVIFLILVEFLNVYDRELEGEFLGGSA
jgi:hypothetical protein